MKVLLINGPVVDDSDAWFYDYFGDPCVTPSKVRAFLDEAEGQAIQVSINSGGGSVFAGSEIYTMLKSYSGQVDVVVSGLAASIASVIMLAGDTIKAAPLAQVMIHNAQMGQWGDYRDFEHASLVIGGVSQSLVDLYATRTGLSAAEIKDLVDAESWFTAERAKELGFIDDVLFQEKPELIASVGHYASREKIDQLKQLLTQEEASPSKAMDNSVLARLDKIEAELASKENPTECTLKLDTDEFEASIRKVLAELSQEEETKAMSPFAKFI